MKKGLLIGCGSVVGLFILLGACMAALGGESEPNTTPIAQENKADEEKTEENKQKVAKIGDAVKAGDLVFKVLDVETKKVIKDPLGQEYKPGAGQYLILEVEVKNEGKEKITMDASMTKLKDKEGAEYEADVEADVWINEGGSQVGGFFLEPLNPNATKKAKIAFDVPMEPAESFTFIAQGGFLSGESVAIQLKK